MIEQKDTLSYKVEEPLLKAVSPEMTEKKTVCNPQRSPSNMVLKAKLWSIIGESEEHWNIT